MNFGTPRQISSRKMLFLSFSGVRVQDPDLMALGLTLPGFVERSRVIASLPSLGLLTLCAWTPENWQISYEEFDQVPQDAAEAIAEAGWAAVAISSLTARVLDAYLLADKLRQLGVLVILGGLHASAMPDEDCVSHHIATMHASDRYLAPSSAC